MIKKKTKKKETIFDTTELEITDEIEGALKIMENTHDTVYVTGKAGTGKSTLLKHFCKNTTKKIAIVAPTGVAAINVGGMTIHSFFKFPFGILEESDIEFLFFKKELFENLETLVIDEVSMVRADLMNAIDVSLRKNTGNKNLPFGGVQIIMFGDLYQLPPVVTSAEEREYLQENYGGIYFFNAPVFREMRLNKIDLNKIFRQKNDDVFVNVLNNIRECRVTYTDLSALNQQVKAYDEKSGPAILLATTNNIVDSINESELKKIRGREHVFKHSISGDFDTRKSPAELELKLKNGAQIMMIKNDTQVPRRWGNGTLGTIVALKKDKIVVGIGKEYYTIEKATWDDFEYEYDAEDQTVERLSKGSFMQYPIKLEIGRAHV